MNLLTYIDSELCSIMDECRQRRWDVYGTPPITRQIISRAMDIATHLPNVLPTVALVTGKISFEWHRDKENTFWLGIEEEGDVYYMGIIDGKQFKGSFKYSGGNLPDVVNSSIRFIGGTNRKD